ncbi:MAG: 4Fe-4S dicluster domain-containing protein [Candidatus Omnitrophica bacterium]|nr:4Fe-4S dicluster domain-containing protein [Candidatus Omnitrophota bacterium]
MDCRIGRIADMNKEAYNASECIECGKCEGKCPYNIPIINKMKEVHNLFGG